jgi:hypothetical protein
MTSPRQIEANRRNAIKSTGPRTQAGKDRSRRNALRHGLTAETVIAEIEDPQDYRCFEAAVTADFSPETAVERQLVLRLASLLWRLRRAAAIETGMFENAVTSIDQSDQTTEPDIQPLACVVQIGSSASSSKLNSSSTSSARYQASYRSNDADRAEKHPQAGARGISVLARRFLHLAAEDQGAFVRLGRYETALWRQVCQAVFMLEVLRRQGLDMKWLPRSFRPEGSKFFAMSVPRRG